MKRNHFELSITVFLLITVSSMLGVNENKPAPVEGRSEQVSNTSKVSGEEINWQVISVGGHMIDIIDTFLISGTVGQTAVGVGSVNDSIIDHGFWQTICIRGYTSPGQNVEVPLTDSLTITFEDVTEPGFTEVSIDSIGGGAPEGFRLVPSSPPIFYNITTTAIFEGEITICLLYDENDIQGKEENLRLLHWSDEIPPGWIDITDTVYTEENRICGTTTSLSDFVMAEPIPYVCGDANADETINVSDAVYIISYIFKGGPAPDPLCVADANGDGTVNIADAVYLITYIFKGGPAPVEDCCL